MELIKRTWIWVLVILVVAGIFAAFRLTRLAVSTLFAITIALFFDFYPARRASQLNPIEALRYEKTTDFDMLIYAHSIWSEAMKSLRRNLIKTVLTVLGLVVGIAASVL